VCSNNSAHIHSKEIWGEERVGGIDDPHFEIWPLVGMHSCRVPYRRPPGIRCILTHPRNYIRRLSCCLADTDFSGCCVRVCVCVCVCAFAFEQSTKNETKKATNCSAARNDDGAAEVTQFVFKHVFCNRNLGLRAGIIFHRATISGLSTSRKFRCFVFRS